MSFPLAVDRNGKEGGTDWIDVVAWRGTVEVLCNYADKGRMIGVEGRLQMRDWTDKDGNKRRNAEVIADNVYFGNSRSDNASGDHQAAKAPVNVDAEDFDEVEDDDDLPF